MKALLTYILILCGCILCADEILLRSGETATGKVTALSAAGAVLNNGRTVPADQLGKIVFADRKNLPHGPHRLILSDGSVLTGRYRMGTGRSFLFRSDTFGAAEWRLRDVARIIFDIKFREDKAKEGEGEPHLIYNQINAVPQSGRVLRFRERQLEFSMRTHTQMFAVERVSAIYLSELPKPAAQSVTLRNGESVAVESMTLNGDRIQVKWCGGEKEIPLHAIREIKFNHIQEKTK